jgi:predicted O-methyltransferase YrrM
MANAATFLDENVLHVGATKFHCAFPEQPTPEGHLSVMKDRVLVERYLRLSEEIRPALIVELGIRRGGSTALLWELNEPEKLVALEISPEPQPLLRDFIESRGLGDGLRPRYGIDQSDRDRVAAVLDEEFGDRPIDLVIDDASHFYDETVSSFETIFPRLAPGALFVIEDWNHEHVVAEKIALAVADTSRPDHDALVRRLDEMKAEQLASAPPRPPLVRMPVELVLACASLGDVVREVAIDDDWVVVRRGAEPLDPRTFRLADLVHDHFGLINREPNPNSAR